MTVATYAAAQLLRALPRTRITRVVGRLADAKLPPQVARAVVGLYSRAYKVALHEADVPDAPWESFDQFFTRKLKTGVRAFCDDPTTVVSPADGKIESFGPVDLDATLQVKGKPYRVAELIGDDEDAARYAGGQFFIVYLSPRDYHRVHSPVAGVVSRVRSLPGDLYPVNSIGELHVPKLFSTNRRVSVVIDTETRGRVTVVLVGAMIVGRITVRDVEGRDVPLGDHAISPPRPVARDEEIGMFHLGSTAVVFLEKDAAPPLTITPGPILFGAPLHGPDAKGGSST